MTKATDIIKNISHELCLTSLDQFALYLEVEGELRCIKSEEFVFDALRQTMPDIELQFGQKRSLSCKLMCSLYAYENQISRLITFIY